MQAVGCLKFWNMTKSGGQFALASPTPNSGVLVSCPPCFMPVLRMRMVSPVSLQLPKLPTQREFLHKRCHVSWVRLHRTNRRSSNRSTNDPGQASTSAHPDAAVTKHHVHSLLSVACTLLRRGIVVPNVRNVRNVLGKKRVFNVYLIIWTFFVVFRFS